MLLKNDRNYINNITREIISSAYQVGNVLGHGFLEKVYENALVYELRKRSLKAEPQKTVQVFYDNTVVGTYTLDILVEECVVAELKTVKELNQAHMAQCLNYLKATNLNICLLLNFGPRVEVKRIVNGFLK